MAANGLTIEDFEADYTAEIWPDCQRSFDVFCAMSTQWRTGMNGATGLDYSAIPQVLRLCRVPRTEWADVFEDLRVMESAALKQMSQN
jgi:hypothetical protein